jgi:hypothetical protein
LATEVLEKRRIKMTKRIWKRKRSTIKIRSRTARPES